MPVLLCHLCAILGLGLNIISHIIYSIKLRQLSVAVYQVTSTGVLWCRDYAKRIDEALFFKAEIYVDSSLVTCMLFAIR